jgi:zinc transport system substrate-binding protein
VRIALVFAVAALVAGCGGSSADGPTVVAGFYPLAWAAEAIEQNRADVVNVTPTGAEPHDVELSARSVQTVADADVVLYLGRGLQPALERAVEHTEGRAVDLLAGQTLLPTRDGESSADPHVWLDPVRFAAMVERIGRVLDRPVRGRTVARRVRRLDAEYGRGLAHCARREIVTSHAAFGYLADRYDLTQLPITGLAPEAEPAPRSLERVVDEVRRTGATTVFFETLVSPRLAETVAREADARTAVLNPIESLTASQEDAGADYVSLMRENLTQLRRALACR